MHSPAAISTTASTASPALACPLNHGLAVLDQLLAALTGPDDAPARDIALDLRWQLMQPHSPEVVIREFFRLRAAAEEQHYLSCYRLRRWLESQFVAHVSFDRTQPAHRITLRLDLDDFAELCSHCVACAADGAAVTWSRVRFAAATESVAQTA